MNRLTMIAATAVAVVLALSNTAQARLGIAPLAIQDGATSRDDAVIQVRGGHRGWHRGRGHHYGWRHHHRRHWY